MAKKIVNTGIAAFDDGVVASHLTLQNTMATVSTQAAADTAYRAHFNRCIALALANGVSAQVYIEGLRNVGTHA